MAPVVELRDEKLENKKPRKKRNRSNSSALRGIERYSKFIPRLFVLLSYSIVPTSSL